MASVMQGLGAVQSTHSDKIGIDYVNERLTRFNSVLERHVDRLRSAGDRLFGADAPTSAKDPQVAQLLASSTTQLLSEIDQKLFAIEYQINRLVNE